MGEGPFGMGGDAGAFFFFFPPDVFCRLLRVIFCANLFLKNICAASFF